MVFKKNKVIQFSTYYPKIHNVFPEPEPMSKALPNWFKKQPSYIDNDRSIVRGNQSLTVKKCIAFFDVISSGYVLRCPYDLSIDTTDGKELYQIPQLMSTLTNPMIGGHQSSQISHYPIDHEKYMENLLRINMVWLIKTPPGYSSLVLDIQHGDNLPIKAVSAIIDTDTFMSDGLFSFIVEKNYKGIIKKGTPLVQIIPFKRESWKAEVLKDTTILEKLRHQRYIVRSMFSKGYKTFFWHKKEYK